MSNKDLMEVIVSLAKRRGFVFQSSEIYGGLNGCYDYGPLGVELLRNIKEAWWKEMTYREDIEGIDASILMHPRVWEASGHVENFTDPMVDCKNCKSRYRLDVLYDMMSKKTRKEIDEKITEGTSVEEVVKESLGIIPCPNCGNRETFTDAKQFNLMFKTHIGASEDSSAVVYLRPETAQGIYVNFLNVREAARQKIPFGIAQIGKSFRNEINTKNFLFRVREFEQMEMQYFVKPGEDEKWFEYWKELRMKWFEKYGLNKDKLKFFKHEKLAHYAKEAYDIEYEFPFGWGELEGIHNRTDFDLKRHTEYSGKKIEYFDEQEKQKYIPYVIETAVGATRSFLAFLVDAYDDEEIKKEDGKSETRTVLHFHPALAPIKAAVFPLVNKDGMPEIAQEITKDLRNDFKVFYDDSGAVGRRYRRQDECGTPYCITVDTQTLEDGKVTVRDRDSMEQERVNKDNLSAYIKEKLNK